MNTGVKRSERHARRIAGASFSAGMSSPCTRGRERATFHSLTPQFSAQAHPGAREARVGKRTRGARGAISRPHPEVQLSQLLVHLRNLLDELVALRLLCRRGNEGEIASASGLRGRGGSVGCAREGSGGVGGWVGGVAAEVAQARHQLLEFVRHVLLHNLLPVGALEEHRAAADDVHDALRAAAARGAGGGVWSEWVGYPPRRRRAPLCC